MLTFRKRRSLVGLGLVLVGALLLAGCSPSSPAPNNDGPPNYGEVDKKYLKRYLFRIGIGVQTTAKPVLTIGFKSTITKSFPISFQSPLIFFTILPYLRAYQ